MDCFLISNELRYPTPKGKRRGAMEEALQEQVLALQQQLAAGDAEVAALKQREPCTTQPAGQSSRTPD